MRIRSIVVVTLVTLVVAAFVGYTGLALKDQRSAPARPGRTADGVILLPNGWRIAPAGRHIPVGDLPLNMVLSPDGRYVIVTNNGYSKPSLTVVDLQHFRVATRVWLEEAWLGLAWHPDGTRIYSSIENGVREFGYENGSLVPARTFRLPPSPTGNAFTGGISVSPDGKRLFVVRVLAQSVSAIDLTTGTVEKTVEMPAEPYTCMVSPDGARVFVSLWGGGKVLVYDAKSLELVSQVPVGDHPNAMVFSKDVKRLFVACANTNAVWVVNLDTMSAAEQIGIALYPQAPAGSTPNGLGLSPDGGTLYVANADNNTVAVVDIAESGRSEVEGFIPAGWYPTGVITAEDQVLILSGKGLQSSANPEGPKPTTPRPLQYIGGLLEGALSSLPAPEGAELARLTKTVYSVTPYTDAGRLAPVAAPKSSPIPSKVGDRSPIKHVFYIIRENRTYDQVLGDMKAGNGDPELCLFGEEVTPNAHAISQEFVLFDNFYVDAEVSYDGHAFSTGAYATDVVEKMWPTNYGGRGGVYLSEGGGKMRSEYGNITAPSQGYIWDFCNRAGVSVRSYGEFVSRTKEDPGSPEVQASVPGLEGFIHPTYPPYDLSIPDVKRADIWLEEFRKFEADGSLPRLSIIRLPNDHTLGTRPGAPTPQAMVADNDLALGRILEAISKSRYWKESAVFVLEDDAQNGSDHVDAHRSVLLMASPYARRGTVDSTLYTTSGVLRTMELVLGLPPMSQYDAAATPMYNAFQLTPNTAPYTARPARIPLDTTNAATAYGAERSLAMNLSEPDRAPDLELNEIIWKAIRGAGSPMPPPRRSGFIHSIEDEEEEERERAAAASPPAAVKK